MKRLMILAALVCSVAFLSACSCLMCRVGLAPCAPLGDGCFGVNKPRYDSSDRATIKRMRARKAAVEKAAKKQASKDKKE